MPFKSKNQRACKYCEKPAQKNIIKGRNKGWLRTCGSKECLSRGFHGSSHLKGKKGSKHPKWKPYLSIRPQGKYLLIKVENRKRWMFLHRYVISQHLGRELKTNEIVHHRDGDGTNNQISNLELLTRHPTAPHICPNCGFKYYHKKEQKNVSI